MFESIVVLHMHSTKPAGFADPTFEGLLIAQNEGDKQVTTDRERLDATRLVPQLT